VRWKLAFMIDDKK